MKSYYIYYLEGTKIYKMIYHDFINLSTQIKDTVKDDESFTLQNSDTTWGKGSSDMQRTKAQIQKYDYFFLFLHKKHIL